MSDIVRAVRVIEYIGDREWVETTLERSIQGELVCGLAPDRSPRTIRGSTVVFSDVVYRESGDPRFHRPVPVQP